ncbi:hypothetical protein ACFWDW_26835, partial [Streptomyces roseolus]
MVGPQEDLIMPTSRPHHGERAEGALAHLLLVVVLALGVFMMHSVGHPEGPATGTSATAAAHVGAPGGGPAAADHGAPGRGGAGARAARAAHRPA